MPETDYSVRRSDGSAKWLIGGTLVALGGLGIFLMYIASEMRNVGPTGASSLGIIGLIGTIAFGAVVLGPIGRAVGKRILDPGSPHDQEMGEEVQDLRLQAEDLRQALSEVQERLDFTERMLAGGREKSSEELH